MLNGKHNVTENHDAATVDVSVVIPVYRSGEVLAKLVAEVRAVLKQRGRSFEIVLVDDASPDHAWEEIVRCHHEDPEHVVGVQLMRNFGQHNALMCGFRQARGQWIVTMDDDFQHPPAELPKLLDEIESSNLDLVYGAYRQKKHASGRNLGTRLVCWFYRRVFKVPIEVTSLRVMRRELARSILSYDLNFTYIDGLLAWNTQRIGAVEVDHQPRQSGRSGYSLGKLLTLALNLFTNFSLLPLQIASAVGLLAAVGGLATGLYYLIYSMLSTISVPGYASIIVAVLVLGGLQLLALGIIGEYIGRMHLNVNRKPQYTIRNVMRTPIDRDSIENIARDSINSEDQVMV